MLLSKGDALISKKNSERYTVTHVATDANGDLIFYVAEDAARSAIIVYAWDTGRWHSIPNMSKVDAATREADTNALADDMIILLRGGRTLQHTREVYLRMAERWNAGPDDYQARAEIIERAFYRATQRASGVDITAGLPD